MSSHSLTHWSLGDLDSIWKMQFSVLCYWLVSSDLMIMPPHEWQSLTDDKSILVQVMAWCRQATSYYLSQCWPSSMSPYVVIVAYWLHMRGIALSSMVQAMLFAHIFCANHYLKRCWVMIRQTFVKRSSVWIERKLAIIYLPLKIIQKIAPATFWQFRPDANGLD